MKTKKNYLLAFFLTVLISSSVFSQRIVGYFPDYQYAAGTVNQIQYAKLTHLIYFSLSPMSNNGTVSTATSTWFNLASFNAVVDAAKTANPNIKIIIATGGAPASGDGGSNGGDIHLRLRDIAANTVAGSRAQFVSDIGNFIQTYSRTVGGVTYTLDGWDFDWEFPNYLNSNAADTTNFRNLLGLMRTRLNTAGTALCKNLEISIAVNGEPSIFQTNPSTASYLSPGVINNVDYVNIMSYDANLAAHPTYSNHGPLSFAQDAVIALTSPPFNWPKNKLLIGIPFYGKNGGTSSSYSAINSTNSAAIYNNVSDVSGGFGYNACPTITDKVNYVKAQGLAGVFIWEVTLDRKTTPAASATNSLLSCTYSAVGSTIWTSPEMTCCQKPALGNDISSCNSAYPITLNSATTVGSGTYVWKRIAPTTTTLSAAFTNTATVTSGDGPGTYVVIRTETISGALCSRSDTLIINASLPSPVFAASSISLCTASYLLTPTNSFAFPAGTTFQWQFNSSNITGQTTTSMYASTQGIYTLVASLTGCGSTSASVTITAGSGTGIPVDACRTTAGTLALSVSGGTGPFNWYNQDSPYGSVLTGGANTSTFTTPVLPLPSTTYYYVEDAGVLGTTYAVGILTSSVCGACAQSSPVAATSTLTSLAMEFVVTNPIRINSVDLYAWGGSAYPFTYKIEIFNQNNTIVYTSPNITYTVSGLKTEVLNASLNPGTYRMRTVVVSGGAPAPAFLHEGTSSFPYTGTDISITVQRNLASYGPFLNWKISNVNGCGRIKVRATVAASCSAPLAVELIELDATRSGNTVSVDWTTSTEQNNDRFEIERSSNGIDFVKIGTSEGAGNSGQLKYYNFIDDKPSSRLNYYRLKQIDFDQRYTYSDIVSVDMQNQTTIRIAPNPFTESFSVYSDATGKKNIFVYDLSGAELMNISSEAITVELGNGLKPGLYIVKVMMEGATQTFKVIK